MKKEPIKEEKAKLVVEEPAKKQKIGYQEPMEVDETKKTLEKQS